MCISKYLVFEYIHRKTNLDLSSVLILFSDFIETSLKLHWTFQKIVVGKYDVLINKGRSVARCPEPRNLINKLIKLQVRNFR